MRSNHLDHAKQGYGHPVLGLVQMKSNIKLSPDSLTPVR